MLAFEVRFNRHIRVLIFITVVQAVLGLAGIG